MKVNIGSGTKVRPGYENIDVRKLPGVRQVDVLKRLPYADASVEEFLAEDVLEHFRPADLRSRVLPEIFRCLADGGQLVAQMPDLHEMVRQWQAKMVDDETMSLRIHGRQDYPQNTHYASYTQTSMAKLLREIGFSSVERVATRQWNMVLRATKGSPARRDKVSEADAPRWQNYWEDRARAHGQLATTRLCPQKWKMVDFRGKSRAARTFWSQRSGPPLL